MATILLGKAYLLSLHVTKPVAMEVATAKQIALQKPVIVVSIAFSVAKLATPPTSETALHSIRDTLTLHEQ